MDLDFRQRHDGYRTTIPFVFGATADLYYLNWGEFFHLAIHEEEDEPDDLEHAYERTHERYLEAIRGARARRLLELGCGTGAFAAWMAERTRGEVIGVDISPMQIARARQRLRGRRRSNLRFLEHDIMRAAELPEKRFDAAVMLDAGCYLPDKRAAIAGIATCLLPSGRLLIVDWCRPEKTTGLEEEMLLEPLYRAWAIPSMESAGSYERALSAARLRLLAVEDLSEKVAPNWERGYRTALHSLSDPLTPRTLLSIASSMAREGPRAMQAAKEHFNAAVLAKVAADAGVLRYTLLLAERA